MTPTQIAAAEAEALGTKTIAGKDGPVTVYAIKRPSMNVPGAPMTVAFANCPDGLAEAQLAELHAWRVALEVEHGFRASDVV